MFAGCFKNTFKEESTHTTGSVDLIETTFYKLLFSMQNGHFQFHNYIAAAFNTAAHWTTKGGKCWIYIEFTA